MGTPCSIALLESDDLIRQLATRWLVAAGYRVHCVTMTGLRDLRVDLLVADIPNPRRSGALVRALRAVQRDAPIMLVSARFHRSPEPAAELAAQLGVAAALAKPYSKDELIAAVEAALKRSP